MYLCAKFYVLIIIILLSKLVLAACVLGYGCLDVTTPQVAMRINSKVEMSVDTLPAAALGLHGSVMPFDGSEDNWSDYCERLEHCFTANYIAAEDKKRAILDLLNRVGPATYRLLKTLVLPEKLTDLMFSEIVERVKKHFNPKPSPIVKRIRV